MNDLSMAQKIGFLWYRTFDTGGYVLNSLQKVNFPLRLLFFLLFIGSFALFILFSLSVLFTVADLPAWLNISLKFISGIAVSFACGIVFLESIIHLDANAVRVAAECEMKQKKPFKFGGMKFSWRIALYISIWISGLFLLRSRIYDYLVSAAGGEDVAMGIEQRERFLKAFFEITGRYELYFTLFFFASAILFEWYNKRRVFA